MIGANGVTARFLQQKGFPALRRVLRSPERWARIVDLARDLGEHLPPHPECQALQEFLEKRRQADPERFPDLSLSVVKLLGRGEYVLELPGQPVRWTLRACGEGLHPFDGAESALPGSAHAAPAEGGAFRQPRRRIATDELGELARHCTEQEDNAAKVERQVRKVGRRAAARIARGRAL